MRDGVVHGRTQLPGDPELAGFILKTTLRREFPFLTDARFARLSTREVRYYLAYLEGVAEGNRDLAERAKTGG